MSDTWPSLVGLIVQIGGFEIRETACPRSDSRWIAAPLLFGRLMNIKIFQKFVLAVPSINEQGVEIS